MQGLTGTLFTRPVCYGILRRTAPDGQLSPVRGVGRATRSASPIGGHQRTHLQREPELRRVDLLSVCMSYAGIVVQLARLACHLAPQRS